MYCLTLSLILVNIRNAPPSSLPRATLKQNPANTAPAHTHSTDNIFKKASLHIPVAPSSYTHTYESFHRPTHTPSGHAHTATGRHLTAPPPTCYSRRRRWPAQRDPPPPSARAAGGDAPGCASRPCRRPWRAPCPCRS